MVHKTRSPGLALLLASAAPALATAPAFAQDAPPPGITIADGEETILVTGSRIARPNENSASPIQTVTPRDFVLTGVPNVEQTLNLMPQLVAGFTNTSNNPGSGAATLDLRGLGSVRTLILVNGRRWIASDAGEVPEIDVNTIPAALIERVDIVTGGASAVYGSDAVTGVVNFILNDDLDGLHLDARQNITELGDGRVSSADLSFGTAILGGRGRVIASAGWLNQSPILNARRTLSRVTLQDACAVPGTRDETGASVAVNDPDCLPPNEIALVAGGSSFIPGSRIPGRALFPVAGSDVLVPNGGGFRFDPDGTARPFFFGTDAYNFAPDNYLQVGLERWSANLLGSVEISRAATPYVELSWIETRSPLQLAPVPAAIGGGAGTVPVARINLANPFLTAATAQIFDLNYGVDTEGDVGFLNTATGPKVNPAFGGDADGIVAFPIILQSRLDLGPRRLMNRREAMRGLVGLRGELDRNWSYDAYYSRSRVEHVTAYVNSGSALRLQQAILAVRDPATGAITCLDPSNGCAPANIFGAGNLSAEAADFIRTNPTDLTIVEEQVAEAAVRGEFPFLAAGPAGFAGGVTWRRSAYDFRPDPSLFTNDDLGFVPGTPAAGSTRVWELFAEARLPLLADRRFARAVAVELGLRWSSYDTVGGVWTWKALGDWTPVRGLRLRGGYQRAVRAPNVRELFAAEVISADGALDPCSAFVGLLTDPANAAACLANGVPADQLGEDLFNAAIVSQRGNPDLDAETARTLTAGFVLAPDFAPGFSLAVDYYDVRIQQAIGTFGGGDLFTLFGCIAGGGDPADPLCQAYERAPDGTVASVDLPTANLGVVAASGIDWQLGYARSLGDWFGVPNRIELRFDGTRYFSSGFRANDNVPFLDCAGFFGQPCGNTIDGAAIPAWKLFNRLIWTMGPAALSFRHRWFSSTLDGRIALNDTLSLPDNQLPEEGRRLESRHYFDLAASFRIGERFDLTLGVNNLFDREAAITGSNAAQSNTDPSLYDMLGRRFFVVLAVALP